MCVIGHDTFFPIYKMQALGHLHACLPRLVGHGDTTTQCNGNCVSDCATGPLHGIPPAPGNPPPGGPNPQIPYCPECGKEVTHQRCVGKSTRSCVRQPCVLVRPARAQAPVGARGSRASAGGWVWTPQRHTVRPRCYAVCESVVYLKPSMDSCATSRLGRDLKFYAHHVGKKLTSATLG